MNTTKRDSHGAVAGQIDCRVRPDVEHVDAVMRAVYAMLRSAPNFDGRIGDIETALWAALGAVRAAERGRLFRLHPPLMLMDADGNVRGVGG